jgi:hypothetical protein
MSDGTNDMAHDFSRALVMAAVTILCIVFCAGMAVGAAIRWGVS